MAMDIDRIRSHFENEASSYDGIIDRLVPGYHEQHEVVLRLIPFDRDAQFRALDLGSGTEAKIRGYLAGLTDGMLGEKPENCEYARLALVLGQFRHLYAHIGIINCYSAASG